MAELLAESLQAALHVRVVILGGKPRLLSQTVAMAVAFKR